MSDYEERKARAIAMPPRPRPLTETERAARRYDWLHIAVRIAGSGRTFVVQAISNEDAVWRAEHQVRKGEKIQSYTLQGRAY